MDKIYINKHLYEGFINFKIIHFTNFFQFSSMKHDIFLNRVAFIDTIALAH